MIHHYKDLVYYQISQANLKKRVFTFVALNPEDKTSVVHIISIASSKPIYLS